MEAEQAACAARKHVYILAGYAEPPVPSPCASQEKDQPGHQKGDAGAATSNEAVSRCVEEGCAAVLLSFIVSVLALQCAKRLCKDSRLRGLVEE